MTRDTFDMFERPARGRFGDNESESVRGNDSVRSDLVDLELVYRDQKPLALAVSLHGKKKWVWLPKSKIEFEKTGAFEVKVTMPTWLAKDKELI